MKKYFYLIAFVLFSTILQPQHVTAASQTVEAYEHKRIANIKVQIENLPSTMRFNPSQVLAKLESKVGDPFSQLVFDQDLKQLSEEYEKAIPTFEVKGGELYITIKLWQKPVIHSIRFEGNSKFKSKKLQKELDISPYTIYNRDEFNIAFNKLKEFYIKKGYFESQLSYKINPSSNQNEIDIVIHVHEGRSGHVKEVSFTGFTSKEKSEILEMIHTKKYNLFTSWISGKGVFHEEAMEHDKLTIVDYLQNQGYADAHVDIATKEVPGGIAIRISAVKGPIFKFGKITFKGNTLYTDAEIRKTLPIEEGQSYSPERLRDSLQYLKDLYGKKGHIDADIQYNLQLVQTEPVYNIHFQIEENEQYKIGLIKVLGNSQTQSKVILRESLLVPGEIFDSRRLKATQQRLEAMGYFKTVNVYAIKSTDDALLGPNYRDVIIEVDETTTGNISLFFGLSSVDSIFGGLDLGESNFNYKGLGSFWRDGLSALRGGGEYARAKLSLGAKESSYGISWLTPYLAETLWRLGFDLNYSRSHVQSDDYHVDSLGFSLYSNYPVTQFWTYGLRYRIKNSMIHVKKSAGQQALEQEENSSLITGFSTSMNYDSTDNAYKPHRGLRTNWEAELALTRRHADEQKVFPFMRFAMLNTYYYPVWRKGTLKARMDSKFIYLFGGNGKFDNLPVSERFFLGGETTVRGYKAFRLGPKFIKDGRPTKNATGGISSFLLSVEYLQNIYKPIDAFVFFDGGSISDQEFRIGHFRMSYGTGLRLEISQNMPITVGIGFPINPGDEPTKNFFFAMGGQF